MQNIRSYNYIYMKRTTSLKTRLGLVIGLWVVGFVAGSLMFFITDYRDWEWYLLAITMFPAGLLVPVLAFMDQGMPQYVYYVLWAGYFGASGYLVWVKNARVFWYGLAGLAVVVFLDIGGCAFVIHQGSK
ncbi:hypothetical protein BH09VER1_BH09VER1_04220 [soil metagenome]